MGQIWATSGVRFFLATQYIKSSVTYMVIPRDLHEAKYTDIIGAKLCQICPIQLSSFLFRVIFLNNGRITTNNKYKICRASATHNN